MKGRPSRTAIEKKAIETYGEPMQMVVCMEECAELIEAICENLKPKHFYTHILLKNELIDNARAIKAACKELRNDPYCSIKIADINHDHAIEEMADVQIMLDQMRMIFGPTLIAEDAKLTRQAKRMGMMEVKE